MNAKYKRRFEQIHRGMIEIRDIPGFKFVYIHVGNHFGDTAGCLLVGDSYSRDDDGDYILHKSTKAYTRLYRMLVEAVSLGQAELMIK